MLAKKVIAFSSKYPLFLFSSDPSLFNKIGGEEVYKKAYVIFNNKIKANHSLINYFQKTPLSIMNEHQKNILSVAFGKEIKHSPIQVKEAHLPYEIRETDFDLLVAELADTLSNLMLPEEIISEALTNIEKYRELIIERTLCQKMGGESKIEELMSTFFGRVLNDSELKDYYNNNKPAKLKESYTKFFIMMFGGTNKYSGKDLRLCHKSMDLTDRHFYLYKKHLSESMVICQYDSKIIEEAIHKMERQRTAVLNFQTPFEELGGKFGITQIIESWFNKALNDPLLKPIFREVDIGQLKEKMTDFLSHELGNNEKVAIRDLKSVHAKYNLSDFHLDAFKVWIQKTLEEQNISDWVIRDVQWVLEKYRRDVCRVNIYDIIGGESTVLEITTNMANKVRSHPQLSKFFKKYKLDELKLILRSMLSYALGGPRAFRGKDIKVGHANLGIGNKDFEEMKKIVETVLKEMGIVDSLIVQLIKVMETKRNDVVDSG